MAAVQSEAVVNSVQFLSDGSLAGLCADDAVRVWDAASGALKRTVKREKGPAGFVARELVGVLAGDVKLLDVASGKIVRTQAGPAGMKVRNMAVSADRRVMAMATRPDRKSEDTVHVLGADGAWKPGAPAGIGGVSAMALSPDGSQLVAASYDTDVRAWNARNGELLVRVTELPLALFAMAFSPDGRWLAAGGADRLVHLFDTRSWKLVRSLKGQNEMVQTLAFSADGKRLLTGGFNDITVKHPVQALLWDLASGAVLKRFEMPRQVRSVAVSPDGRWGAATVGDKSVSLLALP